MVERSLSEDLAAAARELQSEVSAQHTMDKVVELARELVPGCEHAGISLVHANRRIDTPAATGDVAVIVDRLQYEFDEGPCLDAIRTEEVAHSSDIGEDARWPRWGPRTAEETGIRSMLCFRLFTFETVVGGLNLYASRPAAFDETDYDHGLALAAHAAVAVARAQQVDQMQLAIDGRTVIGQAQGILMERFDIDAEQAFQVLARVSSHTNTKLRTIANDLIRTRKTPGT